MNVPIRAATAAGHAIVRVCDRRRHRRRGIACACNRRHEVLLIDRERVAAQASGGNAGALAFSDILPLASPGILRKAPRWLFDPLGPLAIRPGYLPRIAPWLLRFWRASQPDRVRASTAAQAAMMDLSAAETPLLLASAGAGDMLRNDGVLHLYESEAELAGVAARMAGARRPRHRVHALHGAHAIAELQPGLSPALVAATFVPGWKTVSDPLAGDRSAGSASSSRTGGRILDAPTRWRLRPPGRRRGATARWAAARRARVVVAAGAWSHQLARTLGERIPLETERGYNTTLPPGAFDLKRQLTFGGHGFVVTPLECGVRVGGAVEFAGLDAPPNFARAAMLLAKAKRFMPGLAHGRRQRVDGVSSVAARFAARDRPGRADERVVYAFGHGHLGLTQAAATARLVADILRMRPAIVSRRFPQRFGPHGEATHGRTVPAPR